MILVILQLIWLNEVMMDWLMLIDVLIKI